LLVVQAGQFYQVHLLVRYSRSTFPPLGAFKRILDFGAEVVADNLETRFFSGCDESFSPDNSGIGVVLSPAT